MEAGLKGGKAPRPVAGSRSRFVRLSERGAGGSSGHSSMEGASDRTESGPLTGLWGKAVLAAGGGSKGPEHVATGGVRGRRALLARGRQRRGTRGAPSRARRYRSPPGFRGARDRQMAERVSGGSTEARVASSNAKRPGVPAEATPLVGFGLRKWTEHTGSRAIGSRCT